MKLTSLPAVEGSMKLTRILSIVSVLALSSMATGCFVNTNEDADDSTLLVINESDYFIDVLNLVPDYADTWGRNYVGSAGLAPGEDITLVDIECDYYDARLIDEFDNECILYGVDLCFDDATWYIDNDTCDVFALQGE